MTTPKNRKELIEVLGDTAPGRRVDPESIIEAIEGLGLAIVPKEPTVPMWEAMAENDSGGMKAEYRVAIAASPFRKEDAAQ
jgi:hypothetical protein